VVAGAWFGVEVVIEEITQKYANKKPKIAVIGPTHYQLFQRPIEVLGLEVIGFDFVNFKGSTPKTKEEIDQILKCKPNVVFVTNPNNPIGEYFPSNLLRYLISTCKKRKIFVIIDEMQNFLATDGKGINYGKWIKAKNVIRIDSFSKHYALAEYRVGWVIADKSIIGSRYTGITQHVRGLMGNAPRAANDAIVKLLDFEINEIRNKIEHPLGRRIKLLYKKEDFIIKLLSKNPRIEIIHRDACFNLTVRIKDFPSDIEMSRRLMNRGTLIMPCTGYGYRTEDVVMRITFAERWSRIKHSMAVLTSILNEKK
jgi:aspartate/methionine/tyrosine aminotransferase